mgnify:CR=1 FL=1
MGSALHMLSSQARSLVDCFLFSARSFCHCLPQNRPSLMPAWKGSGSWASAMPQLFYGLQHRRFPWHWKKYPTDHHHYSGILCIPCHLVLYGVRTLPDHFLALSPVYFLMGNYRLCGGSVLCCKLPENPGLKLQIYSADEALIWRFFFISFSCFMYICLYKADMIVYNYPVVLLHDAVVAV